MVTIRKQDCAVIVSDYVSRLVYSEFGSGKTNGVNCLGLVRKFLRDFMGIAEPFPWPGDVAPGEAGAALYSYFKKTEAPSIGDVVLMDGKHGEGLHVGIYIYNGSSRGVLHASSQAGVIWSTIKTVDVRGYYRHRGLL